MKVDVKVTVTDVEENTEEFTMGSALKAVCKVFEVREDDLLSPHRASYITTPRFALMYLGCYMTNNSTTTVGRFLNRDHTTIIHGRNRASQLRRTNKAFAERLEQSEELAIEYDRQRRQKLNNYKREIEKRMETACQRVAKTGELSGDKVVFDGRDSDGQHRVA